MNKFVEEAPYHPGYEDAVMGNGFHEEDLIKQQEINEMMKYKERHLNTAANIIKFMKGGQKWQR